MKKEVMQMKKIIVSLLTLLILLGTPTAVGAKRDEVKVKPTVKQERRELRERKKQATFWGKIKSVSGSSFVLKVFLRGEVTVTVGEGAKIVDRREKPIAFSDLRAGHWVRVTGLWDSSLKTVEDVRTIKDWSLAVKPTPAP